MPESALVDAKYISVSSFALKEDFFPSSRKLNEYVALSIDKQKGDTKNAGHFYRH